MVLALASLEALELHSLDISQAFINGDLDTEIYMEMPEGWDGAQKGKVLRLKKALYGLKQAGRLWNKKLHSTLESLTFTRLKSDPSVLRFLSLRRNVTYLGSPKLGRLYRYVKSLPTFCFPHIFSSTSSSTYFATSLYHTKFALSNGAKSLICYIGK